ncbi:nitroreductase family protein [Clostridiaceae bacterium HSG29]|nr:nitroreductase family protein [Clostridiaceae bacterium HSG29]
MNDVLKTITQRNSLRKYKNKRISDEDLNLILESAMRAPTAGNQMLYSIILITKQELKDKLAISCDNQPFIKKAPLVMVFVADQQKWHDYYKLSDIDGYLKENNKLYRKPKESDFLLACEDALIAAQNTVIAAESLNIGSCYIGDILENFEYHKELLNLPEYATPITMICFGYYEDGYKTIRRDRFDRKYIVFENSYERLSDEKLEDMFKSREKLYVENNKYNAKNFGQMFYARKTGAEFSAEMERSVKEILKKWKE